MTKQSMNRLFYVTLFLLTTVTTYSQAKHPKEKKASSASSGYPVDFLKTLGREANDSIPSLGSFLVWRHDTLLYEDYFHGANNQTAFNIKSVTKSIVSAIAGTAKDRNLLPTLNTPVLAILQEYSKPLYSSHVWFAADKAINDSIRNVMTLKNLLTMQAGFEWNDFGPLAGAMIASSDPVRFTLDLSYDEYPGGTFNYNTGATLIFGAALAKSVKTDLRAFADSTLFQPVGMTLQRWDTDPLGRYLGGSEMYMTSRDMGRFGLLYLHNGKVGNKQVISKTWIQESTAEQAELNHWDVMPNADGYGYYWWRRKTNGHQAYIASGYGGQLICIIPDLDMVILATCFLNDKNRGREEIKRLHGFIDKIVVATK